MKINGVLIKSNRALEAESDSRFPMTKAKSVLRNELRAIGVQATLYGCEQLLIQHGDYGEWHHVSKFAREVDYYDVDAVVELFKESGCEELAQLAKASKPKKTLHEPIKQMVKLKYRDYVSSTRYHVKHYTGPAKITGNWIEFGGKRKLLSGKFLDVHFISEESSASNPVSC